MTRPRLHTSETGPCFIPLFHTSVSDREDPRRGPPPNRFVPEMKAGPGSGWFEGRQPPQRGGSGERQPPRGIKQLPLFHRGLGGGSPPKECRGLHPLAFREIDTRAPGAAQTLNRHDFPTLQDPTQLLAVAFLCVLAVGRLARYVLSVR